MYFALTGTNARLYKFLICAFQRKPKSTGVSWGSLPSKNMLQVPGIFQEAVEKERARRAGSLSTRVFETRTAIGREQFAFLDRIVSQIFMLFISNGEKILSNVNVVVWGQVKSENSSLPVAVRVSKTRVLKLPTKFLWGDVFCVRCILR